MKHAIAANKTPAAAGAPPQSEPRDCANAARRQHATLAGEKRVSASFARSRARGSRMK